MIRKISQLFQKLNPEPLETSSESQHQAIAGLLCEVSHADSVADLDEHQAKVSLLQKITEISESESIALIEKGSQQLKDAVSLFEYTTQLRAMDPEQRFELIQGLWEVAYADGTVDPQEEAIIRQVAELLYVDHSEYIRAKLLVVPH
ncbi:hypothetical protein ST37_15175 [Vibrio sp. qd031]|uniref:tellurite resistance TerB family protein n=1 Tax=Vibrio sp. qd031 TaxID=1603038 RepID=UPI000A113C06|nr:TerB family tellurite resistance protein [Vibrio sp. qd031]ORT49696.1 hypothetical protein ST37_15175 [Vibrio sp. qd031]